MTDTTEAKRESVGRSPWAERALVAALVCLVAPFSPNVVRAEVLPSSPASDAVEAPVQADVSQASDVEEAEAGGDPTENGDETKAEADSATDVEEAAAEADSPQETQDANAEIAPEADGDEVPANADPGVEAAEGETEVDTEAADADTVPAEDEFGDDPMLDLALGDGDEDILFQEIPSVYGVSKFEQKITEAPSFVTLITSDEINKYGYRTLAEVLSSVTGFFVTYDRNYNYLGVRGFNSPGDFNTRVLVMVDGHRLNDNLYDQGGVGTEAVVDVDLIDRVEVIRGPSSSLYGTNAFFGVINVITKRGRDIQGVEVSGEVGSFDTYRTRATYGDRFSSGIELLLSGSFYDSEGEDYLYYPEFDNQFGDGYTRGADEDRFPSFTGKLSYRDVTLQSGFVSREKGIPTASYGTFFPTDQTRSTDEHLYAFLDWDHQFDSNLNLSGRIYYDRFYYQGDYLYNNADDGDPPDLVLNRDKSTGEWWGAEAKVGRTFFDAHNVTAGVEYRDNFRQDLWNADTNPEVVLLDDERDSWFAAVFLQDEYQIFEDLILNAGVRYDHYDSFGSTVNPRIALIYNLEKTTFKALYGTAFRAPNAYESFYQGTGFIANPDLDPETIQTYELVLEHSLTPYMRATVAGYVYRIDDLIGQVDLDPDLQFQNLGEIEAKGLELQLEMDERGPLGISGRLGYALQETKDRKTNSRLTNSPTHLVNLNLSAPIFEDMLFGGLEFNYASERKTLAGGTADHHYVTNFTLLTKNLLKGLEVSASVKNLFDENYSHPGSGEQVQDQIEQDGRSFWLKMKYGF